MPAPRHVLAAAIAFAVTLPAAAFGQSASCSTTGQNLFVRDALEELYLWYRELPPVDAAAYDSPEAYLDAVRYRPRDTSFSYITSRAASDAFYSESQYIGFGLSTSTATGELRVLQVFDDSPATEAGLARGARITAVGGVAADTLIADGTVDQAFGAASEGVEIAIAFETRDGAARTATMRKRPVTIPTVSLTRVFDVDGRRVGYVFFRNFVRPSTAALDAAFASLAEAGVTELVLDLRYNGGGLVDVAVHLASLIGGSATANQVFAEYRHNDRNRRRDETLRFAAPAHALGLSRVVVIASRASASASELVINGLRPFVAVTVVGDRTYGKPVGQYVLPFCDRVLAPVAFSMVNANGQGDYFDGLAAECPAGDDIGRDLGDAAEASLAEALVVVRTGTCSPRATALGGRARPALAAAPAAGWASLLNAR
ncbi:MAG: S41 family peptidase [Vicinamibacterales bacterium]